MAPRQHRTTVDRILVAGDVSDLDAIQDVLDGLPANSYGQVFIEAIDAAEQVPLRAPGRVTVTWLARDTRPSSSDLLVFAARGEALTEAIAGWIAEWMPGEAEAVGEHFVWLGCAASSHVAALADHLSARLTGLQALPQP